MIEAKVDDHNGTYSDTGSTWCMGPDSFSVAMDHDPKTGEIKGMDIIAIRKVARFTFHRKGDTIEMVLDGKDGGPDRVLVRFTQKEST